MRRLLRLGCTLIALALLVLLALVLVSLIRAAVVALQTPAPTPAVPQMTRPTTAAPRIVSFGRVAHTAGWDFHILSLTRTPTLPESTGSTAQAQGVFLLLRVKVTNRQTATSVLNSWDFTLVDRQGRHYDTSSTDADYLFFSTTVQPSLSTTIHLLFDVAPDATGIHLRVQDGTLLALGA